MDIVKEAIKRYGCKNDHISYDAFEMYCAAEIIRKFKPNILFTHPGHVDRERHRTGLFTSAVEQAIRDTDTWLGWLFDAIRDAGIENETDFVVLSDHGQLNIVRRVCPNVFLADAGLIETDKEGKITSWKAYAHSCALSCQIYLSDPRR